MKIIDFLQSNDPVPSTVKAERPQSKLWLNIGYEKNGRFVNLPVGLPLDTMEKVVAKGQNEDWLKFQHARNALLEALQSLAHSLAPGQEETIPNLVIRVRRVNEEMSVSSADNEYGIDPSELFAKRA